MTRPPRSIPVDHREIRSPGARVRLFARTGRTRYREFRQRRADERAWSPASLGRVPPPRVGTLPRPDPKLRLHRREPNPVATQGKILLGVFLLIALAALVWGWFATRVDADLAGVTPGAALTPEEAQGLSFTIDVSPADRLDEATLTFDGADVVEEATIEDGVIEYTPAELGEGEHRLGLTVPRPLLSPATMTWDFLVDGTPPRIDVPPYLPEHDMEEPVTIEGSVDGAEELLVDGEPYELGEDGSFRLDYDAPPTGPVELTATDVAGNRRSVDVYVPVEFPDDIHGVHVTATAWDDPTLRQGVIDLIDAGVVNTVVLSLKDEGGIVGHRSAVPLAQEIGASRDLYDLREQVEFLHDEDVRVTGRIVAFRDPMLASAAWERGDEDMVIQTPEGGRYGAYGGGFVNLAHPEVQQYNLDLAVEAVEAGVDDVLWDYIRRPDGFIEEMRIPGLEGDPSDIVADFLAESHAAVRRHGAVQGASVFGVAATRPEQIAQNILAMAGHTDYTAPMLYPSHWNPGEYGVENPESQPYEIVKRSLRDFEQQVARTGRPLVPWLQHFSLDVEYGPAEIRAQIRATAEVSHNGWMMWDPGVTYDAEALRVAEDGTPAP